MATQRITKTTTKTTTTRTTVRKKVGRPKGAKDKQPRKTRSDKGKKRSVYAGKPTKSS